MKESNTSSAVSPVSLVKEAWGEVGASFERFCLTTGIATLSSMMEEDAALLCGPRYGRKDGKDGHRWGRTRLRSELYSLDRLSFRLAILIERHRSQEFRKR